MRAMWARNLGTAALLLTVLASGCGGSAAWLEAPLPDYGPVQQPAALADDAPKVRLRTNLGDIVIALYPDQAPVSTDNFLQYVASGFYDGTQFHRVVAAAPPYMIQGGGFDADRNEKATRGPIINESTNGLSNVRGTVAMARTGDPDSATSGFYINFRDNLYLDARDGRPGYAVFGVVVEGMDVVDRMSTAPTREIPRTQFAALPVDPIVVESSRLER